MSLLPTVLLAFALLLGGCAGPRREAPSVPIDRPYVLVLGTAQDGGLPQLGCAGACCRAARADPRRARLVTSLLVVDPASGGRWLLDAGPDLPEQVERAAAHPPGRAMPGARPPLFEGVFLTHAHVGHYLGLAHLGREAYGVQGQRTYATARMAAFLRTNGPWSQLVATGGLDLVELTPGVPVRLTEELSVEALAVPHRDEYSDTVGFVVRGPERALLYLPDIDKWERWDRRLEDVLGDVDVALVDATFHGPAELPGRDMASIPHPFVVETLARLEALPEAQRARLLAKVWFTHLNHSNPIADPASPQAAAVRAAGAHVAADGDVHAL